jgi:hypothetical protein
MGKMVSVLDGSGRAMPGLRQLVHWYLGPVGLLFGLGLIAAFVAAMLGFSSVASALLIIDLAIVVPWKFLRQRDELRQNANDTAAAHDAINIRVSETLTRPTIDAILKAFRRADRETLKKLRLRVGRLQQNQDRTNADVTNLAGQLGNLDGSVADTLAQNDALLKRHDEALALNDALLKRHDVVLFQRDEVNIVETLAARVHELETTLTRLQRSQVEIVAELDQRFGADKQLVIGLGTGRSGTVSMSRLLDAQTSSSVDHELLPLLPWTFDQAQINFRLGQFGNRPTRIVGDVAYYYLPYVRHIAARLPETRFVCMRREREAVIDSMMRKTRNDNLWVDHDGSEWTLNEVWDKTMPSYPPMPKREAIARYWDEYNSEALALSEELGDRFEIFDLESTFDDEAEIRRLLDHVGVERDAQNIVLNIHENTGPLSAAG